jgi:hypothetical protein
VINQFALFLRLFLEYGNLEFSRNIVIKMHDLKNGRKYHPSTFLIKLVNHKFEEKVIFFFLVALNDTLPFLSESLEDEHPDVEMTAKEIVKKVETLTGATIQDYLK